MRSQTYHFLHDFTPKDSPKDESNQCIFILGGEDWSSNEAKGTNLTVLLWGVEGTHSLAVVGGVFIALKHGTVDDGIDSFSLSSETMNIHHDIGRIYQSVLQLGCKNLVRTSVNRFSGGIVISVVWRIDGTILDPDSLSEMTSCAQIGIVSKRFAEFVVGILFKGRGLLG